MHLKINAPSYTLKGASIQLDGLDITHAVTELTLEIASGVINNVEMKLLLADGVEVEVGRS